MSHFESRNNEGNCTAPCSSPRDKCKEKDCRCYNGSCLLCPLYRWVLTATNEYGSGGEWRWLCDRLDCLNCDAAMEHSFGADETKFGANHYWLDDDD